MGSGIAQVAATTGHRVTVVDIDENLLKNTKNIISKSFDRIVKKKYSESPEVNVVMHATV